MSGPARVSLLEFAFAIWHRGRAAMLRSVLLLVLSALTEGAGLLLLVPMLAQAGVSLGSGPMDGMARRVGALLLSVGLPMSLPVVLAVTVVVLGVRTLLVQAESVQSARLAQHVVSQERQRLFRAIVSLPWPKFVRLRSADVVQALTVYTDNANAATRLLLHLLAEALAMSVSLLIALRISWPVTLFVVAAGLALFGLLRWLRAPGRAEGAQLMAFGEALFRATTDIIGGMKAVKGYAAERRTIGDYTRLDDALTQSARQFDAHRARAAAAVGLGSAVMLGVIVYVALAVLRLSPAALLLLLAIYARLVPRVAAAQMQWQSLQESLATWDALQEMIATSERDSESLPDLPVRVAHGSAAPTVALANVTYQYEGATRAAMQCGSFHLPAGRMTAIVGPSGAGKSTAVDLIIGLLRPQEGVVSADGAVLDDQALRTWRARDGLLPQDVVLFPGSVRENLQWAQPGASDAAMHAALDAASARFVDLLPEGLDTPIGDRGAMLSGGERQRLGLARALLREPALLVLDEATSALDAEHETAILQSLRALLPRMTVVIVSHRLRVARAADHVVVLDDGVVLAEGTWESVSATDERVRTLLAL